VVLLATAAIAGQIVITRGGSYTFAIGNNNPNIQAVEIKTTGLVRPSPTSIRSGPPRDYAEQDAKKWLPPGITLAK
jgi:hypothetical protein